MKKIFARQKDGGKGSTKITPLTLDMPAHQQQVLQQSKRSPDGPMQFARHSASDEPDPWVLVSGAAGNKLNAETVGPHGPQQHQQHLRRRSSSADDFSMQSPRRIPETRPPSHSILPAGASPPVPSNNGTSIGLPNTLSSDLTATVIDREKDHRGVMKRKNGHSHNPASLLRALDPRANERSNDSPQHPPSPVPQQTREDSGRGDKESERRRVSGHSEKKERTREREKDHHKDGDAFGDVSLRSMIGWWSASSSEDWSLALHICEAASLNEANAKEAAKALRKTLKWGDPGPQLSAARLWAIMLRNPSSFFIAEATSPKFLSSIEDVVTKPTTTPVVKSRVLEVLSGAAHAHPGQVHSSNGPLEAFKRDKGGGYGALWRKVKPTSYPDEGIPFDPSDPMFSPPDPNTHSNLPNGKANPKQIRDSSPLSSPKHHLQANNMQTPRPAPKQHRPRGSHGSNIQRVIPVDEDVRRLFEECEIAKSNAHVLNQALTYASPDELQENEVIQEYHAKCLNSETLLTSQIGWASAQVDRLKELRGIPPESLPDPPHPKAEQLLEAILASNHEIAEALRIYDDLKRVGDEAFQEREVAERSKRDVRLDRSQIQYIRSDGSFQMQVPGGGISASGPSRTPSPGLEPPSLGMHSNNGSHPSLNSLSLSHSHHQSAHNSQHHLGLPLPLARPVPHGPRKPIPRSRSPSPDRSVEHNHLYSRIPCLDADSAFRQANDDSSDEMEVPFKPTAKAMGKRRMEASPERSEPDDSLRGDEGCHSRSSSFSESDDSRIRPHWKSQPQVYAYDALAERTKQMEEEMRRLLKERG